LMLSRQGHPSSIRDEREISRSAVKKGRGRMPRGGFAAERRRTPGLSLAGFRHSTVYGSRCGRMCDLWARAKGGRGGFEGSAMQIACTRTASKKTFQFSHGIGSRSGMASTWRRPCWN